MDVEDFPPPPPEMLADSVPLTDEDEGETFDFDDSGDDIPEADRLPPATPTPLATSTNHQGQNQTVVSQPELHLTSPDPPAPSATSHTAPSSADTAVASSKSSTVGGATAEEGEGTDNTGTDLPPLPPPPLVDDAETDPGRTGGEGQDASTDAPHPPHAVPRSPSQGKANPYSVIDITPLQLQQLEQQHEHPHGPSSGACSPTEPQGGSQDVPSSPVGIASGYSVPVPCGYATPSGVPLITPAYSTPVIIRHLSVDEDGKVEPAASSSNNNEADQMLSMCILLLLYFIHSIIVI
ncbi:Rho guanine nucleotide exchange factor 10 [Liparis tanakae]|uniref:Rho guanine nucleotide exchange factor 10 n=1 Tax=Liparis tanakae TaxID=230148 RepID=A0A4Z2IYE4_9TELE|nr:Rho guanine nucleotide exchange factor 10 [Liparis tanakae]